MSVFKLYSKERRTSGGVRRMHRSPNLPNAFRRQVFTLIKAVVGEETLFGRAPANEIYWNAKKLLCHEYGIEELVALDGQNALLGLVSSAVLKHYFFAEQDLGKCLDLIQVVFSLVEQAQERGIVFTGSQMSFEDGTTELNLRFREHGMDFQYAHGQILQVDSELAYQSITTPALKLLRESYLVGANQEFLAAQEHLRQGRYKECLNDCLKAFESTMKAICHRRKWVFSQTDTAKKLIKICEDNKLFPVFLESHLTGLRTVLESGVPTARNKLSGHGQGVTPITVSETFAAYVLNLTASNILFLAAAEKKFKW